LSDCLSSNSGRILCIHFKAVNLYLNKTYIKSRK